MGGSLLGAFAFRPVWAASRGDARSPESQDPRPRETIDTPMMVEGAGSPRWGEALLGLSLGDRLEGLRVVALPQPWCGSLPVLARTPEGRLLQIDVLRNERPSDEAVASTEHHALYLSTGATAGTATIEQWGLGVMALRDQIARREAEGARFPALLTRRERALRHAGRMLVLAR
jgi:hypothetical protein